MCSFYSFQNISIPFTSLSDNIIYNYIKYNKTTDWFILWSKWSHKNIMNSFSLLSWSQKHPRFHTLEQTCWLCSVKLFSFSDRLFLIWCGWHHYKPVEMTFHFIVHCLCTCTHWIVFIWGIVRKWTFQMPISSWFLPAWYYVRLHSWGIHLVLEEYNSLWQYCHMIYRL